MAYDFLVIDSYNLAYRHWWAVRDLKYNDQFVGLEYGFIKKVLSYIKKYGQEKIYLAWDGKPERCQGLTENYKAGRVKVNANEGDWTPRLNKLKDVFSHLCNTLYNPSEEADEQIAKFVLSNKEKRILIVSGDKDLQQFINSIVHVESGSDLINGEAAFNKWQVPAYKIPLYKSLDGDSSDNIKGVPRLATKTKIKLVNMSANIDELISNFSLSELTEKEKIKLKEHEQIVLNNYKLVNLMEFKEKPDISEPDGDKTYLSSLINELNFKSIVF